MAAAVFKTSSYTSQLVYFFDQVRLCCSVNFILTFLVANLGVAQCSVIAIGIELACTWRGLYRKEAPLFLIAGK